MATKQKYHKLLEPLQIKNVKLRNRIVKSAQWFIYAEPDGSVGERIKGWYESVAKGGVGLVTVEECICQYALGASDVPHLRLDDDKFISGLSELAEVIHKHGCPTFVQITHAGPAHQLKVDGLQPVAPSSIDPPAEPTFAIARELTIPEIKELVEMYAQAALRVKKAGFDGAEMHMAHYGLGNAFLSRIQNKRQDEYGCQSLENRARFDVEILRRVRELTGPDFVVGCRMNCKEWGHELGTTPEEAVRFAQMFEEAGADYLQLSAYGYGPFYLCAIPSIMLYPEPAEVTKSFVDRLPNGILIPEVEVVRKAVSIPCSGVGQLDYDIAERLLEEDRVDMCCFGRSLMADPEWPNKLKEGREEDIRPCTSCLWCIHVMLLAQPVECRVNAFAGHETTLIMKPAEKKRRVMVVGAGPAGMEVARVAAERGHEVTLYDKAPDIGGLLPMAVFIKGNKIMAYVDDISKLLDYYKTQLKKLGVNVQLGKEVDANLVNEVKPDVVIVAVGGQPIEPALRVGRAKVVNTEQLKKGAERFVRLVGPRRMSMLTKVFLPVGKKIVVIGSDLAGLETAEFLAKRGKEVTILDEAEQMGEGMPLHWLMTYIPWMQAKKIGIFNGVKYQEATSKGITITTKEGEAKTIEADNVIVVNKYKKNADLYQALEGKVTELYLIGDAKSDERGYIVGAIHDGARLALTI